MKKELILLPSVTYAMKAKSVLDKYNIRSFIQRTPKTVKIKSCGYCLYVPGDTDKTEKLLRDNGIRVLGRGERGDI